MSEIRGSKERWIKHYSSAHHILLVGEGDFSFSLCLAMAFGSATKIVATSLDSYDELINKYKNAKENLAILRAQGAYVLHGVDAKQMKTLPELCWRRFHRIIYNFPHAGFYGKEDNPHMIMMHRDLVRGFLQNASSMLWLDGEIHINHKTTPPFDSWRVEDLASECSLFCIGQDVFKSEDYPWYHNKRGSGPRPDEPFPLGACRTFMFKLRSDAEKNLMIPQMFSTPPAGMQHSPSSPFTFYDTDLPISTRQTFNDYKSECHRVFGGYLKHVEATFGSISYDVRRSVEEALRLGFEMYVDAGPGRPLNGFVGVLEELHHLSILRSERLRQMLLLYGQQH